MYFLIAGRQTDEFNSVRFVEEVLITTVEAHSFAAANVLGMTTVIVNK
jgi:hypothetical protein